MVLFLIFRLESYVWLVDNNISLNIYLLVELKFKIGVWIVKLKFFVVLWVVLKLFKV